MLSNSLLFQSSRFALLSICLAGFWACQSPEQTCYSTQDPCRKRTTKNLKWEYDELSQKLIFSDQVSNEFSSRDADMFKSKSFTGCVSGTI